MKNFNTLMSEAQKSGFEVYSSYAMPDSSINLDIFTCRKGKYDGEVIDIYYNWKTGEVTQVLYSTQFKNQLPTFKFKS
jgi:hypothetical protein